MLPPPPKQDTVVAGDSITNPTQVKVREVESDVSSSGLPVIPGYEVLDRLGQGGMGRVFKARHLGLQRLDAIKMVAIGAHSGMIARFVEEARAVARLKHQNIAQVYDSGEVDGSPYFAMELFEAGTLAQKLAGQPQEAKWSARLIMTLAEAMEYCHQQGIIHRDLKPSNILISVETTVLSAEKNTSKDKVTSDVVPKIADFGLVKQMGGDSQQTQTGDIIGTPSYMAPEQASGMVKHVGPGSDIYALGAILYECLTGRPPFKTPDGMQTLLLVISSDPVPASQLVPKLPRDLNTICMKCLEKQPGRRYLTAQALADDLKRFLEGESIAARPVGRLEKTWKWCKRRPAWAALIVLGLVSLVGFGVGYIRLSEAYSEMNVAKNESDSHLLAARKVLDRMTQRYAEDLAPIPHTEEIRQQGLQEARALYEQLVAIRPRDLASRLNYVESCLRLAQIERILNQFDRADAAYQKAFNTLDDVIRESKSDEHYAKYLNVMVQRANMERERKQLDRCQEFMNQAEPLAEKLGKLDKPSISMLNALSDYYSAMGQSSRVLQKFAVAETHYRKALQCMKQVMLLEGLDGTRRELLALAHNNLGTILLVQKKYDEASSEFDLALGAMPLERHPRIESSLAMMYANQAIVADDFKQWKESRAAYDRAAGIFKKLMADFPMIPDYRFRWARVKLNLIRSIMEREYQETPAMIAEVEPVLDQLVKDYPQQPLYRDQLKMLKTCKETLEYMQKDGGKK